MGRIMPWINDTHRVLDYFGRHMNDGQAGEKVYFPDGRFLIRFGCIAAGLLAGEYIRKRLQ